MSFRRGRMLLAVVVVAAVLVLVSQVAQPAMPREVASQVARKGGEWLLDQAERSKNGPRPGYRRRKTDAHLRRRRQDPPLDHRGAQRGRWYAWT